jgi:hypothetical protein
MKNMIVYTYTHAMKLDEKMSEEIQTACKSNQAREILDGGLFLVTMETIIDFYAIHLFKL